uniref:Uncharacterized protein n=1 Tax=Tetranychus urticae TaxID=32264 RepID=T1KI91_TETUR
MNRLDHRSWRITIKRESLIEKEGFLRSICTPEVHSYLLACHCVIKPVGQRLPW